MPVIPVTLMLPPDVLGVLVKNATKRQTTLEQLCLSILTEKAAQVAAQEAPDASA